MFDLVEDHRIAWALAFAIAAIAAAISYSTAQRNPEYYHMLHHRSIGATDAPCTSACTFLGREDD